MVRLCSVSYTSLSNIRANKKSSGERRLPRLPPLNISSADQIMIYHLLLKPVARARRARRKQPKTQLTYPVQNQNLPCPTLPATLAPSCDSRHRLASCTNPQAQISTPATDAFPARTTTDVSVRFRQQAFRSYFNFTLSLKVGILFRINRNPIHILPLDET